MAHFNSIPHQTAIELLTDGLKTRLLAEVEAALLAVVLPRVKEIAVQTATAMAEQARVEYALIPGERKAEVLFSFNGDIFKEASRG